MAQSSSHRRYARGSVVLEPEVRSRQHPAEIIREREAREEAEHGPIVSRTYLGGGLVRKRHASGYAYDDRLPDGSSY